jgi:hypothetical protein
MTAKAKSRLNRKGILLLADDLVAHKKMYDQDDIGRKDECGTFCCLTGLCYLREIGLMKFNQLLVRDEFDQDTCATSGHNQLGLKIRKDWSGVIFPQIFQNIDMWPADIREEYESNGPTWRVIAALKALQRLRLNGSIDPDPKAVHTRLPQLKALLATAKKRKAA